MLSSVTERSTLARAIRSAGGLVLVAGDAIAAEAGVAPRPDSVDWGTYGPRMSEIYAAEPGPGHRAARRLQDLGLLDAVVTQSDDVLFDEAGVREVIALVGSVELSVCAACAYNEPLGCVLELLPQPRCAACGGLLRPDVVARGEPPRAEALARAQASVAATRLVVLADAPDLPGPLGALSRGALILGADAPGAVLLAATEELAG
jgi:NAD-dependent SIR2 family protein deacetylase